MRDHASTAASRTVSLKNRQTGGGCVGGLLACPRSASSTKDGKAASTWHGWVTTNAGRTTPTKLMHFRAHASELLELSCSLQHGQQGMSALPSIEISTGMVEIAAPTVAGTMATEMAIRAANMTRTMVTDCPSNSGLSRTGNRPRRPRFPSQ